MGNIVTKFKNFTIERYADYWGGWEFVLLKDNDYIARSRDYNDLKKQMYEENIKINNRRL